MFDNAPTAALAKQLASFTLVGLAGLAVDAGLFLWLTSGLYWPVALARSLSVSGSIATTWALNRTVTFARQRSSRRGVEFARYALVQVSGLVLNIGVFALCLWLVPSLRSMPIVPLLLGCAAGYAFNFSAMRAVVFRGASPR